MYSISFAHSFTLHEHGFNTEHQHEPIEVNNTSHGHVHHSHSEKLNIDTDHINHNNHCDDGVFDLITCLLSDLTHHQHDDCEFENQTNNEYKRLTNSNNHKLASPFKIFSNQCIAYNLKLKALFYQLNIDYLSPLIDESPLRGPPVYC